MAATSDPENTMTAVLEPPAPTTTALAENRRTAERVRKSLSVKLTGMGWTKGQSCVAEDIGEGGIYVRLPANSGLSVGQRCALMFPEGLTPPQLSTLAGETVYATVVRTELLAEGAKQLVGAGLRFDRPLFL